MINRDWDNNLLLPHYIYMYIKSSTFVTFDNFEANLNYHKTDRKNGPLICFCFDLIPSFVFNVST